MAAEPVREAALFLARGTNKKKEREE